jgi:hypothetical protein
MAIGKKTGGRDFRPGQGGRRKGAKDRIPRTFKASVRAIFEEVAATHPQMLRDAVTKGLAAPPPKSYPYLQLLAHYVDGKPTEPPSGTGADGLIFPDRLSQLLERLWQAHQQGVPITRVPVADDPRGPIVGANGRRALPRKRPTTPQGPEGAP